MVLFIISFGRRAALFGMLGLVVASVIPVFARNWQDEVLTIEMIQKIKTETSQDARSDGAMRLVVYLRTLDRLRLEELDAVVVDEIAGLLGSDDDSVKLSAALALGHIGKQAMRAVPMLLSALKKEQIPSGSYRLLSGLTAVDGLVQALQELKVCNPTPNVHRHQSCDYLLR
jgi:HEAT repeat protein